MRIADVYEKYGLPVNLQTHMLRVAAFANIIATHWKGPVLNEDALILACLMHDIAKVISFKHFREHEEHLKDIQYKLITKYGKEEHKAALKIAKELGLDTKVLALLRGKSPFEEKAKKILESKGFELKILAYADARISPNGLCTLQERLEDFVKRGHTDVGLLQVVIDIEAQLQTHLDINLKDITPDQLEQMVSVVATYGITV